LGSGADDRLRGRALLFWRKLWVAVGVIDGALARRQHRLVVAADRRADAAGLGREAGSFSISIFRIARQRRGGDLHQARDHRNMLIPQIVFDPRRVVLVDGAQGNRA
jgi:hypothetical protein